MTPLTTPQILALSPVDRQRYYLEMAQSQPLPAYDQPDIGPTRGSAGQIANTAVNQGANYGIRQGIDALGIGGTGGAAANGAASYGGSSALAAPEIVGASRVTGAAAGNAGGAGAAQGAGVGSYVGPALAAAAIAHGGYGLSQNYGKRKPGRMAVAGAETGAGIGYFVGGPVGAGIGGGIGAVTGGAVGMIKAGRHADHSARSQFRDELAQRGIALRTSELGGNLDPAAVTNSKGTYVPLADGTFYDISPERGSKQAYEVLKPEGNWSGQAIGWADALANLATDARDEKITGDTAAMFTNAIRSNAGDDVEMMRANALRMFQQYNINKEQAQQRIMELAKGGKIPQDKAGAYMNAINTMFSGDGYTSNQQLADKGIVFGQKPAQPQQQPTVTPARGGVQGPMILPNKGNQGAQPQGALYAGPGSVLNLNRGMAAQASKATLPFDTSQMVNLPDIVRNSDGRTPRQIAELIANSRR